MAMSTWIADGTQGNLASTAANWDTIPSSGRDIIFDGSSVVNCTFDLAVADFASFSMNAGYTGTVTLVASTNWGTTGDINVAAGIFAPVSTSVITCSGNFTRSGTGTISGGGPNLVMNGAGKAITIGSYPVYRLRASASCTVAGTGTFWTRHLVVDIDVILTLVANIIQFSDSFGYSNLGVIAGTGTLTFNRLGSDRTITFGVINAPVEIRAYTTTTANGIFTLGANTVFGSSLAVLSENATYTMMLDLSNYTLDAGAITLGVRGLTTQGTGALTCTSYTQNGASSVFTQGGYCRIAGTATVSAGTWNVNAVARVGSLSQSGGTITVASGFTLFYDSTASLTGGTRSGVIDRWPFPSEKGDDSVPFETPKAGARF